MTKKQKTELYSMGVMLCIGTLEVILLYFFEFAIVWFGLFFHPDMFSLSDDAMPVQMYHFFFGGDNGFPYIIFFNVAVVILVRSLKQLKTFHQTLTFKKERQPIMRRNKHESI